MNHLWKWELDLNRQGVLIGLFLATEKEVKDICGKRYYIGDCVGKHSEIDGEFTKEEFDIILTNAELRAIGKDIDFAGIGYNPWDYMEDDKN